MTKTTEARLLFLPDSPQLRFLPEGPTGLAPGRFSWVAIQHGADATSGSLNIYDTSTDTNTNYEVPGRPGFAKPTSDPDRYLIGCEHQLGLLSLRDGSWETLNDSVDQGIEGTCVNDGTLYADNLVFGTKDLSFSIPQAGLYLYRGADRKLIRLRDDQICSNGKDVVDSGHGGLHLIDIDSPTRKIVRYRLDIGQGELSECETLVDLSDLDGVPDGMVLTPDEQSLIVSLYNPNPADHGETHQYNILSGELEHIWVTPDSPQNTCPLLLEWLDGTVKLVITTAIEHMSQERQAASKLAGGLFVADTDFQSSPASPVFPLGKLGIA